ncbi:MAG: DNA-processing protein DprA [Nanoarchaeota archaeon]
MGNSGIERIKTEDLIGPLNDVEEKYAASELFTIGNKELLKRRCVSVIGTRNPSMTGIQNAKKITKFLVNNDVVVVSGLAKGIDTVAHTTTIKNNGKTIAVLGTPLDQCYPTENELLLQEIKKNHLAVSQFEVGNKVFPSNFPTRNRTMALLSQASIIIEAGEKSGTMHQGWEALRLGRQLFITEDLIKRDLLWTKKLLEYGAEVLYMDDLEIIMDFLPEKIKGEIECVNF